MNYLNVLYWFYFDEKKFKLFSYLKKNNVDYLLAYKKVDEMTSEKCGIYLTKELSISQAYRTGYSDGDYWNGSQNPYHDNEKEWLDYEKGFEQCKLDKIKHSDNFLIKQAIDKYKNDTSRRL